MMYLLTESCFNEVLQSWHLALNVLVGLCLIFLLCLRFLTCFSIFNKWAQGCLLHWIFIPCWIKTILENSLKCPLLPSLHIFLDYEIANFMGWTSVTLYDLLLLSTLFTDKINRILCCFSVFIFCSFANFLL